MSIRRAVALVGLTAAAIAGTTATAAAHGIGGRLDLPVPIELFIYGAAMVVVVSFVALGVLWKTPRLEEGLPGRTLPRAVVAVTTGAVPDAVVRTISLFVFGVVFAAAAGGNEIAGSNIAPLAVFVWFWVGLAFAHALFGNWWATLSPWDSIARFLGIGDRPRRPYPPGWGLWPAAIGLFAFVWLELVFPDGANPRTLAVGIALYSAVTLAGMGVFGRETWNRHGEAFAVYFRMLSMMAPLARDSDGRVVLRPPLSGLTRLEPRPGLIAVVMVVLGSTTFDGFTGTSTWVRWTDQLGTVAEAAFATLGLLITIALAAGAYALSMLAASSVAKIPWHPLSVRFVHTLVPIAFAYVAAHYASLLLLEGQSGFALISDPFGMGWNLFGTATYAVNYALLSAAAIWYIQVGAIVLGHVAGVVLAHDRALAAFRADRAFKTQYALLAVMVLFTVGGLVILRG